MDEDAYQTLARYYADIRSRLYDADTKEVMDDVEARTADILRDGLSFPAQVVSIEMVRVAIATIGSADSFGEKRYDLPPEPEETSAPPKILYRSRNFNVLGGVCGGFADYFNIDPTLVRILMVVFAFLSLGTVIIVYIIMWAIIPLKPLESNIFGRSKSKHERRR